MNYTSESGEGNLKKKLIFFIKRLAKLLILAICCFLIINIYNEYFCENIVNKVQRFLDNRIVSEEDEKASEILAAQGLITKEEKYFYNQLNEYSKVIYNAMELHKEEMKSGVYEINVGTKFSELYLEENGEDLVDEYYQTAIEAYTYDNPDVFYIDYSKLYLNIKTTTIFNKTTYRFFINSGEKSNYLTEEFNSKEKIDASLKEIERVRDYFIENKKIELYDNVKLIHDYLVDTISYDETLLQPNIYNIYGALVNKLCVCEGYAEAFKYLADSLNIPCILVTGDATSSDGTIEKHAWNYVQLGENWYGVDCTWDDPIIIGPGFLTNSSKYKYFLKGQKQFSKSHVASEKFETSGVAFELPKLSIEKY